MCRKENLIVLVWVSSVCLPLAIGSVFTCCVYVHMLYVSIIFLKYIGLSILGAVGCAGSLTGNSSREAMPSALFYESGFPIYHTCHFVIFFPLGIFVVSLERIRKNNLLPNTPQKEISNGHGEVLRGSQRKL